MNEEKNIGYSNFSVYFDLVEHRHLVEYIEKLKELGFKLYAKGHSNHELRAAGIDEVTPLSQHQAIELSPSLFIVGFRNRPAVNPGNLQEAKEKADFISRALRSDASTVILDDPNCRNATDAVSLKRLIDSLDLSIGIPLSGFRLLDRKNHTSFRKEAIAGTKTHAKYFGMPWEPPN